MIAAVLLTVAAFGAGDCTNCNEGSNAFATAPTRIWLQVVAAAPASHAQIVTMVDAAAAIWAPYNVIVSPVFTQTRPDTEPGQWITLVLRDQPATRLDGQSPAEHLALASLTFVEKTPGNVMYASPDAARRLVQHRWSNPVRDRLSAQLLGRAIAHELGHYLLRSSSHSSAGLMRASFGSVDAVSCDLTRFRLLPEQAAALRH